MGKAVPRPGTALVFACAQAGSPPDAQSSAAQEVLGSLQGYVAGDIGDGFGEGELFAPGLNAILGEAKLPHPAIAGQREAALLLVFRR